MARTCHSKGLASKFHLKLMLISHSYDLRIGKILRLGKSICDSSLQLLHTPFLRAEGKPNSETIKLGSYNYTSRLKGMFVFVCGG